MPDHLQNLSIVEPVLTSLSRGYRNAEFIGLNIFPEVPVEKSNGKIPVFGRENFRIESTKRALYAKSNQGVPETMTTDSFKTEEHDKALPVDQNEVKEAVFAVYQQRSALCNERIALGHEAECAEVAFGYNNYASDHRETLTDDFLQEAGIDPIAFLRQRIMLGREFISKYLNTVVIGGKVWKHLIDHPKISSRMNANSNKVVNINLVKELLQINPAYPLEVYIGDAVYWDDALQTNVDLWGNFISLHYVNRPQVGQQSSVEDASYGYTLRLKGYPYVDRYPEVGNKVEFVRTTDNYVVKVVGPDAGYIIKDPIDPNVYSA